MKDIILDEEKLSARSEEIDVRKDGKLAQQIVCELKEVIREKNLSSLSAPQIGYEKRIFVINFNGDLKSFVNPMISTAKGFELSREECSSLPNKTYIRPRNNDIISYYQTPLGKTESRQFVGLAAKVFQHCVDHLDGLLLKDVGLEIDDDYDNATQEERDKIIDMYLDSLDIKKKEIDKEISEDKELKQLSDAIDFIEKAQKGEVKLVEKKFDSNELNGKNKVKEER